MLLGSAGRRLRDKLARKLEEHADEVVAAYLAGATPLRVDPRVDRARKKPEVAEPTAERAGGHGTRSGGTHGVSVLRALMLLGISKTLRDYLRSAISDTAVEIGILGAGPVPPAAETILVFLYAVEELYDLSTPPPTSAKQVPPVLRLRYLVTCTSASAIDLQERLSRVLDAFDRNPVFRGQDLDGSISDKIETVTVQLRAPASDELMNIWTALRTGMVLSLYYEVTAEPSPQ